MKKRRLADRKKSASTAGRLRIVAGKWRSRLLPVAELPGLRPTPAQVRETLFNWLAADIQGTRCLDLYAGTGALGFEALSRGAASAHFVEQASIAAAVLRDSIAILDATDASITQADVNRFLHTTPATPYDLVFLDPPFSEDMLQELCRLLQTNNWLSTKARVYLEQPIERRAPGLPPGWTVQRENTAGKVRYLLAATAA